LEAMRGSVTRIRQVCWLLLSASLAAGCATQRPLTSAPLYPPAPTAVPGAFTHTVAPGETLWSIGKQYSV
jgi:hypothetical protein